jgi:preprotein translocase subunit YajC
VFFAENSPSSGSSFGGVFEILIIALFIGAMYFLFIRPNNRRRREQMELQSGLGPGDEVRTIGGLYGTVVATDTDSVTIAAAPGVELRFDRQAISRVINKTAAAESTEDGPADEDETDADDSAH